MDTWKGEKLHGPDRRLTRAQLEEMDRVPTPRRTRRYRVTARMAKALGRLYVATSGRGPNWRTAVATLSRAPRRLGGQRGGLGRLRCRLLQRPQAAGASGRHPHR